MNLDGLYYLSSYFRRGKVRKGYIHHNLNITTTLTSNIYYYLDTLFKTNLILVWKIFLFCRFCRDIPSSFYKYIYRHYFLDTQSYISLQYCIEDKLHRINLREWARFRKNSNLTSSINLLIPSYAPR